MNDARYLQILEVLDEEQLQFEAWQESEEPYPDQPYWTALEAAIDEFKRGELPGRLNQASQYAGRLEAEYDRFNNSGSPLPGTEFWGLRDSLQKAARKEPPKLSPLPSVADLVVKQGVSHVQAARIWKLFDGSDRPRTELIEKELAEPGSVITDEWKAHVNQLRMAEAGFSTTPVAAAPVQDKPHVPSIEELIEQGANVEQIARVKANQYGSAGESWNRLIVAIAALMGRSIEVSRESALAKAGAKEIADRHGEKAVSRPPNVTGVMHPHEIEPGDDEQGDEVEGAGEVEAEDIEAQITALAEDGHDEKTIAQHVKQPLKKVKAVLKKWRELQESK